MGSPRVVIVEDENIVALDIKYHLQKYGYIIIGMYSSGEEALEHLPANLPDIVLMDVKLQGEMDGLQTAKIIRDEYNLPVVILTAFADDNTLERVKESNSFGYIIKPFEERELRSGIELALYRDKMEKTLVEREERFSTTLESIADAVIVTDVNEVITYINPVAEKLAEIKAVSSMGKKFSEVFVLKEDAADSAFPESVFTETYLAANISKRMIPVEKKKSVLTDRKGSGFGFVWVLNDMTERHEAERALRASEQRYREFFEDDLSGAFVANQEGRIIACNKSFARIFGFEDMQKAVNINIRSFFVTDEDHEQFWTELREQKKMELQELTLINQEDKPLTILANVIGNFDENNVLRKIKGYLIDITERKRLEEQLLQTQKMDAIGRLAGGVAHDFNNVLTIILGYCNLILDTDVTVYDIRPDVVGIQRAAKKASNLTRQLLTFSKNQIIQLRIIDLNEIVTDLKKMLRRLITDDIEMNIFLEDQTVHVNVDPGKIEQVLINLVVNARDAMPEGGTLTIETKKLALKKRLATSVEDIPEGFYVLLSIKDTGIGMSDEVKSKIFEPFFSTKASDKGTGLGLATVYGIIKQSSGFIDVISEVGKGSTFNFFLPFVERGEEDHEYETEYVTEAHGDESILIVESEEFIRKLTSRILGGKGYTVYEAQNGGEGLLICEEKNNKVDIAVIDVILPHINGYKLAQRLRMIRPELKVLLMSGGPEDDKKIDNKDDVHVIYKPFDAEVFSTRIRRILDGVEEPGTTS